MASELPPLVAEDRLPVRAQLPPEDQMHPRFRGTFRTACTAFVALIPLLATACSNDDETNSVPGIYELTRINGLAPPLTVSPGDGHTYVVTEGFVALDTDNTYGGEIMGTRDGVIFSFFEDAGVWTQSGNQITFNSDDPAVPDYAAQVNGSTLVGSQTIQGVSVSVTFLKQ